MATQKKTVARKKSARKASTSVATRASDIVEEQLTRYQSMRDFGITAEPSGKTKASSGARGGKLPFVIQKHAASHLHYDFRLGWNGVLKSWACAKGPSYYPGDRRLAVQVEDHPIEYGGFEGIIPAGQYGGGTVMLWDQGTWKPQLGHEDVDAGLRSGSLKFTMYGKRMKGNWTLVRMGGKAANERKPNWLLIKEHDRFERAEEDQPITERYTTSVTTSRSMEQISASEDHVWNSKDTNTGNARHRKEPLAKPRKKISASFSNDLAHSPKESLPDFVPPQLATQVSTPATASGWVQELKLDGYRVQARLREGKVQLLTRTGLDWTHRMQSVANEIAQLPAGEALLDGEVVVLRNDGTTSFADLQAAFQDKTAKPLTYFVFDLLHLNGHNLRTLPLLKRKAMLTKLLGDSSETVRLSEHLDADAATMFTKACELHAEGIISKRADAIYTSGRSTSWVKLKCIHEQEFVIGGFTLPAKGRAGAQAIGSLLLGYYDAGKLIYAGRTGTGFTMTTHKTMRIRLETLRQAKTPFDHPPVEAKKGAIWVKPTLVAEVRFATWTADDLVRQASFQGLREDKPAKEVTREEGAPKPRTARKSASHPAALPIAEKLTTAVAHAPVRLTHPDKKLDAASGLTKQQLADYYWAIAPQILPHIAGRPVSLVRCPEGTASACFFQKHTTTMLPAGIDSIDITDKKTGKPEPYITFSTPEALASLAQMGVLEIHAWGSRNEDLEHPDRIIFDLDPHESISWSILASAANEVRKRLSKLGLKSFLKATGGKGLHIIAPIEPKHDWTTVKEFAHAFALEMEASDRTLYLTKMTKSARVGKIYLDYLRNERGATAIVAFSPRARSGAPVALPLSWNELRLASRPLFRVSDYATWKDRLSRNPWKEMPTTRQTLSPEALSLGAR